MTRAAACPARLEAPQLGTYTEAIQEAVKWLKQWPDSEASHTACSKANAEPLATDAVGPSASDAPKDEDLDT